MDKTTETLDRLVKQVFGPDCRVQTSSGTALGPGAVSIFVGEELLGTGEDFQGALRQAMREIGLRQRREKANEPTRGLTLGAAFDQPAAGQG